MTFILGDVEPTQQQLIDCGLVSDVAVRESATAVSTLRRVADLDARASVLRDRVAVSDDSLAAFLVPVPQGYTPEQAAAFKREISKSLSQIIADAESEVAYRTMWEKLGDNE